MNRLTAPPGAATARLLALLAALALLLAGAPLTDPADAQEPGGEGEIEISSGDGLVPSVRFAATNRFETPQLIATDDTEFAADFDGDDVILARADLFPDALAGSVLAGLEDAPIVLTTNDTADDGGGLNPETQEALDFYDPETVYVLGGTQAIADDLPDAVETAFPDTEVVRLGGVNRFETAALIADRSETSTAIVANGGNFPDALVSGAIATAGEVPILLTGSDGPLDPFMTERLESLGIEQVYLAGGTEALSQSVEDQIADLGITTQRVAGPDRFATAVAFANLGTDQFGFGTDHANLAVADDFPDALALGPHAGLDVGGPAPILLTATDALSSQTADYLTSVSTCEFTALHVAGGVQSVSAGTETEARTILSQPGSACLVELTPESATNLVGETHTVTATVADNGGAPVSGADVGFDVVGETTTVTALPESGTATTGEDGTADFSFQSLVPETYTITACVTDPDGTERCDTASKRFSADAFLDAVSVDGVFEHLEAFQSIADDNGGNRASGTAGYDQSLAYAQGLLDDAGYDTEIQEFTFDQFVETAEPELEQVAPAQTTYTAGEDFVTAEYSGSGEATAPVTTVDPNLADPSASTSGCEPEDFAAFPAGNVALVQRGSCTFQAKAENAEAAGASGVVIFNNVPGEVLNGTLSAAADVTIPVVGISAELGEELAGTPGLELRVAVTAEVTTTTTANLLADTPTGDDGNVVIVGAHLDSVLEGPGLNDNGSGSSAILETALRLAETGISPQNTVRFAFWGAEESGLIGSDEYVAQLTEQEAEDISLYLNFDMVGSPNFARFVYDGDGDAFGLVGPEGSDAIEERLSGFFSDRGQFNEPTAFDGRSDYLAFINVGIPSGGLFSGAEQIKTEGQAAQYGGEAGVAYDPNYHEAGDTIENVSPQAIDEFGDNIANATLLYAASTQDVDGEG